MAPTYTYLHLFFFHLKQYWIEYLGQVSQTLDFIVLSIPFMSVRLLPFQLYYSSYETH